MALLDIVDKLAYICSFPPFMLSHLLFHKVSLNKHIDWLVALKLTFLESVTKTCRLPLIVSEWTATINYFWLIYL